MQRYFVFVTVLKWAAMLWNANGCCGTLDAFQSISLLCSYSLWILSKTLVPEAKLQDIPNPLPSSDPHFLLLQALHWQKTRAMKQSSARLLLSAFFRPEAIWPVQQCRSEKWGGSCSCPILLVVCSILELDLVPPEPVEECRCPTACPYGLWFWPSFLASLQPAGKVKDCRSCKA